MDLLPQLHGCACGGLSVCCDTCIRVKVPSKLNLVSVKAACDAVLCLPAPTQAAGTSARGQNYFPRMTSPLRLACQVGGGFRLGRQARTDAIDQYYVPRMSKSLVPRMQVGGGFRQGRQAMIDALRAGD